MKSTLERLREIGSGRWLGETLPPDCRWQQPTVGVWSGQSAVLSDPGERPASEVAITALNALLKLLPDYPVEVLEFDVNIAPRCIPRG